MGDGITTAALSEEAAQLGFTATVLIDTEQRKLPISALWAWVRPAIQLQQIELIFIESRPVAFCTWAYVTPETASRLSSGEVPLLEDWNDGDELWVVDFVAPYGHARLLAERLRKRLGGRFQRFAFSRHGKRRNLRFGPIYQPTQAAS